MAEQKPAGFDVSVHAPVPFWRDIRVIQIFAQIVFVAAVVLLGVVLANNLVNNLEASNLTMSFRPTEPFDTELSEGQGKLSFLDEVFEKVKDITNYNSEKFSHLDALFLGLKNTLRVVVVGLIGATLLGIIIGVGQLSPNFLIRTIANIYLEIFRNTPLLVQLFFIYFGLWLTIMPEPVSSHEFPGPIFVNVRAVHYPLIQGSDTAWRLYGMALVGIVIGIVLWVWRLRVMEETGKPARTVRWFLPSVVGLTALGWLWAGHPFTVEDPVWMDFNYIGGDKITAEYISLTIGLVLYTAAFIADIVRAGIQAVPHGQIEAARAQGFSGGQTLRLIVLPQALRLIIPPLGNQYLNLAKNSSLGAAIAYLDVYRSASLVASQTDQYIVLFASMMTIYLSLSLIISLGMNALNYRMRLRSR